MKTLLKLTFIALLLIGCKDDRNDSETAEAMDSYVINGTALGIYNGVRVYLKSVDERGRAVDRDTAIVMNEKFTFEGKADIPERLSLHINSVRGNLPLILENGNIEVAVDKDVILNSKISGSKSNEALAKYNSELKQLTEESRQLNMEYRNAISQGDTAKVSDIALTMQKYGEKQTQYPINFIKEHNDNYFSLTLLQDLLQSRTTKFEDVNTAYEALDDNIMNSELGQRVTALVEQKKLEAQRLAALSEGNIAPNFSAPNPDGQPLTLNDIKGKATIVDFWAAWCGPCRRENPNVVNVYNKYHDKGLEIIGVSLDGSSRQADPKAAWLKAIKDDGLTWNHVSNLKYFQDPVAQLYNINSIPATYILDEEGKIVAKNLRGKALEDKIAEMLN